MYRIASQTHGKNRPCKGKNLHPTQILNHRRRPLRQQRPHLLQPFPRLSVNGHRLRFDASPNLNYVGIHSFRRQSAKIRLLRCHRPRIYSALLDSLAHHLVSSLGLPPPQISRHHHRLRSRITGFHPVLKSLSRLKWWAARTSSVDRQASVHKIMDGLID